MPQHTKRLVLNFPGFEPTSPARQIGRLASGGKKTAELWGFELLAGQIIEQPELHKTDTSFHSSGNSWTSDTRYIHFSWGDIIERYESVPYPMNLRRHMGPYLWFFRNGTINKYFKTSARYWGFTIYPILLMVIFVIASWFLAGLATSFLGYGLFLQILIAGLLIFIFCKYPGDRFYINTSINDWAFAQHMCLRSNPEIEARYEEFSAELSRMIEVTDPDEIIVVGHSFGSIWAVMALSGAITINPKLLESKNITFLALGSSMLKIALVKEAEFLRRAVRQVLGLKNLVWHEIQTKTDFVSFYKAEPFKPLDIDQTDAEVIVHRVNFKKALSKKRHRKMMRSMYLAHRQYILYCDKRVHHDFQLRIFGPYAAAELARDTNLALESPLFKTKATT